MSQQEYMWAWIAYLGGFAVFMAALWYATRAFWQIPKVLMRTVVAAVLLVPWYTDTEKDFLSPAWIVSLADTFLHDSSSFWRAGLALVITLGISVSLAVGYLVYSRFRRVPS